MVRIRAPEPAEFDRDVNDPLNKAGEEWVLRLLREFMRRTVLDCRADHGAFDFRILKSNDAGWDVPDEWAFKTLDVKVDKWWDKTHRIVFEERHEYPNGRTRPGWGRKPGLDLMAMLAPVSGQLIIVDVPRFRTLVDECKGRWDLYGKQNRDYTTRFYLVETMQCFQRGIIWLALRLPALIERVTR